MHISVRDASIRFGTQIVFSHLDAEFASGSVTAVVGPSGSGKSSLLSALAGYQALDAGSITISSGESSLPDPRLVAWVPQGSNALGSRSVLDNIMVGALAQGVSISEAEAVAAHWISSVGLTGLETRKAKEISGGELQRLCIARALSSGRPIILADEPSANLDQRNTEIIADLLRAIQSAAIVVVATHDPVLVSAVGHVVRIRDRPRP